ncbi:MAG: hypothetical protein ACXADB_06070 [Candidatus Hermodarchaeia archaeon]
MNKKKLRWAFEGQDDDGNLEFPKSFVKIDRRPAFPYYLVADTEGGHAEPVSAEIGLRQFIDDATEESISFFLEAAKRVTKGTLRCIGRGFFFDGEKLAYAEPDEDKIWEEWSFEGIKMRPQSMGEDSDYYYGYFVDGRDERDGVVIDWIVEYAWSECRLNEGII